MIAGHIHRQNFDVGRVSAESACLLTITSHSCHSFAFRKSSVVNGSFRLYIKFLYTMFKSHADMSNFTFDDDELEFEVVDWRNRGVPVPVQSYNRRTNSVVPQSSSTFYPAEVPRQQNWHRGYNGYSGNFQNPIRQSPTMSEDNWFEEIEEHDYSHLSHNNQSSEAGTESSENSSLRANSLLQETQSPTSVHATTDSTTSSPIQVPKSNLSLVDVLPNVGNGNANGVRFTNHMAAASGASRAKRKRTDMEVDEKSSRSELEELLSKKPTNRASARSYARPTRRGTATAATTALNVSVPSEQTSFNGDADVSSESGSVESAMHLSFGSVHESAEDEDDCPAVLKIRKDIFENSDDDND